MLVFIQPNEFTSLNIIEYLKEVLGRYLTLKQVTHTVIRVWVFKLHNQHHFSCTYMSVFYRYITNNQFFKKFHKFTHCKEIVQITTSSTLNYKK